MSPLYSDVEFMLRRSSESRLKVDRALKSFKKSINKNGDAVYHNFEPKVKYNLCAARILQGNFSEWDGWQYRDDWAATMRYGIKTIPFWLGNHTESLVVIGEQGIGDEILFASLLPEAQLRCDKVTYACDNRLVGIISRSLNVDVRHRHVDAREDLLYGHTAYIPAADLMTLFRKRPEDFPKKPFLKPLKDDFEKYRGRIGVSWRGRHGYIDPIELGLDNPVSLQYNDYHPDIELPDRDGMQLLDLKDDIEGVFSLISVLDRVVTVPTSVMHFAGAIGVKTEVIETPRHTEKEVDGVIDELDFHLANKDGKSYFYSNQTVFDGIKEYHECL